MANLCLVLLSDLPAYMLLQTDSQVHINTGLSPLVYSPVLTSSPMLSVGSAQPSTSMGAGNKHFVIQPVFDQLSILHHFAHHVVRRLISQIQSQKCYHQ